MSRSLVLSSVLVPALVSALALGLALLAPACGSSDAATPAPAAPRTAQPASAGDAKSVCVEVFSKNRTCTDQFIPALVDLRAKYDQPAGIAAEVAAHRDDVIAQAKTEWATDSQPAAIDATCTKIAGSSGPGDQSQFAGVQACLEQQDCGAYVSCVMPYFEKRFAK
jgi:hypothetical protein